MKINTRLISMGLALTLFLGVLSACGEHGAENTTLPEVTQNVTADPSPTPEPTVEPTAEPTPEPSPTPSDPPYDVLRNPNVLWGEPGTGYYSSVMMQGWSNPGVINIMPRLENAMNSATDKNLIAFYVSHDGHRTITPFPGEISFVDLIPIEVKRVKIPDILDPDGELTELVCAADGTLNPVSVKEYLSQFDEDHLEPLANQMETMIREKLVADYGVPPNTSKISSVYLEHRAAAITGLLNENSDFKSLHEEYYLYFYAILDFWCGWLTQQREQFRELLIERGFIPVYSLDQAYAQAREQAPNTPFMPKSRFHPIEEFDKLALIFVGTKQQIEELSIYLSEQKWTSFYFELAGQTELASE